MRANSVIRQCLLQAAPALLGFLLIVLSLGARAETHGYDPDADPAADYQQALTAAGANGKLVLLVFGSEWCADCRSLNQKMGLAPLEATVSGNFVVAHVDIGNWDRNMAFTGQFGDPVGKGIPSIAIIDSDGKALYVSEAGEFATARSSELKDLDQWFQLKLAEIRDQP
jgi:thioredoxin 1